MHRTHTCKAATWEQHSESQGWQYYLDRESFFICSTDTAFVLPRGSFWGTPRCYPTNAVWSKPCHSTAQCHWWGNCPREHRNQHNTTWIFSARQWNADNVTVLRGVCYCRQLVLLYYYSLELWQSRQRAVLTGLNFPVSSVTSWELISSPHKHLWSSSLAVCTRGTAFHNYFVKHYIVFFILFLDLPIPKLLQEND